MVLVVGTFIDLYRTFHGAFLWWDRHRDDSEHEFLQGWGWGQFFEPFSLDAVNRRMRAWRTGELLEEWDEHCDHWMLSG